MKPDEIWTTSILHMAGWLVHAVTEFGKKNLEFMTGQYRHARCLSSCVRTRDTCAQDWDVPQMVVFCPDP